MYDRSLFSLLGIPFLFGACYWLRTYQGRICVGLIACQFFSVGLTWSTSGRFQTPIRPLFCIAAAIGIWLMIVCIMDSKFLKRAFPEQESDS
ncbi:MAG: hypothetical protein COA78_32970 [Blastopirellula sp.]|nr:MAG: hypothetical protein COA78_32970 [Blastopirellula sp.]